MTLPPSPPRSVRRQPLAPASALALSAASDYREKEQYAEQAMAETSTLDVEAVRTLCESIIDAARKDLGP